MSPYNPGQIASKLQAKFSSTAILAASPTQIVKANSSRITIAFAPQT